MKKRTAAAWAAVLAVGIAAGALSAANAAENQAVHPSEVRVPAGFLTAKQALAEFNDIGQATDLTLPNGIKWPTTPPAELSDTEGAFEDGFIETTAHLYWLCAWENTLVNAPAARGTEGAGEEVAAIQDFSESEWFTENNVDPEGAWQEEVLEPALAGDLTGVNQQLSSCGYFDLNQ